MEFLFKLWASSWLEDRLVSHISFLQNALLLGPILNYFDKVPMYIYLIISSWETPSLGSYSPARGRLCPGWRHQEDRALQVHRPSAGCTQRYSHQVGTNIRNVIKSIFSMVTESTVQLHWQCWSQLKLVVSVIITIVIIILAVFCPKDHVDDFRGVAAIIGVAVTFVTEVASNTATANIVVIVNHHHL